MTIVSMNKLSAGR